MPSARFIEATLSPNSAEQPVFLVTIDHASYETPRRWCTGGANITSNGRLFEARAMKVTPPGDSGERNLRRGRLSIDNTTPDAIGPLRTTISRPDVTLELVLAKYPDDIEVSWSGLKVLDQRVNGPAIDLEIGPRDDSVEVFPYQAYTPRRCRGLFN